MAEAKGAVGSGRKAGWVRPIVTAWLLAGTIDIVVACLYYPLTAGVSVTRLLQGIASGLLGMSAFSGGAATAALGLGCHYTIALIWTVFFFFVYPRVSLLSRSRLATGVAYGVFVSAVMNLVVLPLSNVPKRPFSLPHLAVATLILMVTIGPPISFVIGRHYAGLERTS